MSHIDQLTRVLKRELGDATPTASSVQVAWTNMPEREKWEYMEFLKSTGGTWEQAAALVVQLANEETE